MITPADDDDKKIINVVKKDLVKTNQFKDLVRTLAEFIANQINAEDRYTLKVQQLFVYFVYKCTQTDSLNKIDWLQCVRTFHFKVITKMVGETLKNHPQLIGLIEDEEIHQVDNALKSRQSRYPLEKLLKFHYKIYIKILNEVISTDNIRVNIDKNGLKTEEQNYIDVFKDQVINISDSMRDQIKQYIDKETIKKYYHRYNLPPRRNNTVKNYRGTTTTSSGNKNKR